MVHVIALPPPVLVLKDVTCSSSVAMPHGKPHMLASVVPGRERERERKKGKKREIERARQSRNIYIYNIESYTCVYIYIYVQMEIPIDQQICSERHGTSARP